MLTLFFIFVPIYFIFNVMPMPKPQNDAEPFLEITVDGQHKRNFYAGTIHQYKQKQRVKRQGNFEL